MHAYLSGSILIGEPDIWVTLTRSALQSSSPCARLPGSKSPLRTVGLTDFPGKVRTTAVQGCNPMHLGGGGLVSLVRSRPPYSHVKGWGWGKANASPLPIHTWHASPGPRDLLSVAAVLPGAEDEGPAALPALVQALQPLAVDAQIEAPGLAALLGRLFVTTISMATAAAATVAVPMRHAYGNPRSSRRRPDVNRKSGRVSSLPCTWREPSESRGSPARTGASGLLQYHRAILN